MSSLLVKQNPQERTSFILMSRAGTAVVAFDELDRAKERLRTHRSRTGVALNLFKQTITLTPIN